MRRLFCSHNRLESLYIFPILLVLLGEALPCYSQDREDTASSFAIEFRAQFLDAKRGTPKGSAAKLLLAGRSAQEVQALCFDDDPSVALCAAWHRLQLQMQGRLVGSDRGATLVRLPTELSREFLGFVEGRLHVPAPDQWAQDLQFARVSRWGSTLFPATQPAVTQLEAIEPGNAPAEERASMPQVLLSIKSSPAYATFLASESYEGEDAVAYLPDELVATIKELQRDMGEVVITGLSAEGRAVIALPGEGPGSDQLVCVSVTGNKGKPKILWRYQMDSYWAADFQGASWYTEFRFNRGLLFLFHCTHDSIGIECVKFSDGAPVFSFNSRLP